LTTWLRSEVLAGQTAFAECDPARASAAPVFLTKLSRLDVAVEPEEETGRGEAEVVGAPALSTMAGKASGAGKVSAAARL
jgi:hypothetical protein